jgi:hypothetical protein
MGTILENNTKEHTKLYREHTKLYRELMKLYREHMKLYRELGDYQLG